MRILKSIARSRIPARTPGNGDRANTAFYDKIATRARVMSPRHVLPIVCINGDECVRLTSALRSRGISTLRRGLTIYALSPGGSLGPNSKG